MANEETKPDVKPNNTLSIVVKDQDGGEVHFKIKPNTKFEKVFNAYNSRKAAHGFRFIYDGHVIHANQTPVDIGLEDEDIIEAMLEQTGGSQAEDRFAYA